ncbi:MAG: putative maltokinase, partial [Methylococcaceae bacterium]
ALAWENGNLERLHTMTPTTIAKVRQQAQVGILGDAFIDGAFCRALIQAIGARQTLPCEQGTIHFLPTDAFTTLTGEAFANLPLHAPDEQGCNTSVVLGDQLFLKGYRHLQNGTRPEIEIGCFLTDVVKFPNTVPVLGVVEYEGSNGNNMTLALVQGYVENQGNCWRYTLDYLRRFLEECCIALVPAEPAWQVHRNYLILVHTLGKRTGELHNALGKTTGDCAFDPEPVTNNDLIDWVQHVRTEAAVTLDLLEHLKEGLTEAVQETVKTVLAQRVVLDDRLNACVSGSIKAVKTRYHGDYHLGKVLLTQNDCVLTDFEGDPDRPFAERRHKHSPMRDVADMLRSFNHAAYTALAHATAEQPKDKTKFEPLIRQWEAEVASVFLVAYDEAAHSSRPFATATSLRGLLDLFLLEKTFAKLRQELEDFPDWIENPLHDILSLLQPAG